MDTSTLPFATIEQLRTLLAKMRLSPVELTEMFLSRIEQFNPRLNAFRTVTAEGALSAARKAERELLHGRQRGPLHGIPIVLKDNIWTRGVRTTVGSVILRDFVPEEDATVVRRLRRAGAVVLGKTSLHEFAYGITSDNPHFGATQNPWRHGLIPGGSSGGSAAAVTAGLCVAALGSDTGGSIRIPAALCGIVGLRPTLGRVSVHGIFPLAPTFDQAGPLARSADDALLVLSAIAGRDALDPTSAAHSVRDLSRVGAGKKKKFRLGRPREHFWTRLDPEVRRLCEAALQDMAKQGAVIVDVSLPSMEAGVEAANTIAAIEASWVHERAGYFPSRAAEYGADVRLRLEQGSKSRAVDLLTARDTVQRAKAEFAAALEKADAIVGPTTPIAAPPIGTETVSAGGAEEPIRSALVRLNRPGSLTGLPAISIPCGFISDGLPVGIQLIGHAFREAVIVDIARRYEQAHDWQRMHPRLG